MRQFIKKLELPAEATAPTHLRYEDIEAFALSRSDLEDDLEAINENLELIQRTRGGGWPTGPVEPDYNFVDLVWHEQEFREGSSFAYAVRHENESYLGCCYLYPMGQRTELTEELTSFDVDVSWWVTQDAYDSGYDAKLYLALREWLCAQFPFWSPYFSNAEIPSL